MKPFLPWLVLSLLLLPLLSKAETCSPEVDYDSELVLMLFLDEQLLSEGFIAYQNSRNEVLYPLNETLSLLGLNPTLPDTNSTVSTTIFENANQLNINYQNNLATFSNKPLFNQSFQQLITGQYLQCMEGEIYATRALIESFLPASIKYNSALMEVHFSGKRLFPSDISRRKEELIGLEGRKGKKRHNFIEQPYLNEAFSWNIASLSGQLSSEINESHLYLNTSGRFLYHDIELFTSLHKDKQLNSINIVGSKQVLDPKLTPYLTNYKFGDVSMSGVKGVAQNYTGLGLKLTNKPAKLINEPIMDFSGTLPFGWFAELYINQILMGFAEASEENRYNFKNIPVYNGRNAVKIISYGPQGQINQQTETYYMDDLFHNKQRLIYGLDLINVGDKLVHPSQDSNTLSSVKPYQVLHSDLTFGITENLSLKLDSWLKQDPSQLSATAANNTQIHRLGFKARLNKYLFAEAYQPTQFFNDGSKAQASQLKASFQPLPSWSINLSADWFDAKYKNLDFSETASQRFNLRTRYYLNKYKSRLVYEIESNKQASSGRENIAQRFILGKSFDLVNTALSIEQLSNNEGQASYNSSLDLSRSSKGNQQRLSLKSTQNDSFSGLSSLIYSNHNQLNKNWNNVTSVNLDFTNDSSNISTSTLYKHKLFSTGFRINYNSISGWYGGLTFNSSLIKDHDNNMVLLKDASPKKSIVKVKLRLNKADGNKQYINEGELKVDGRTIKLQDKQETIMANDAVYIPNVSPYKWIEVELIEDSLNQSNWAIDSEPKKVIISPGGMETIIYDITETGEIDGIVTLPVTGPDLPEYPAKNVTVYLLTPDGSIVTTVQTAFDGFYLFDKVKPGKYIVLIDPVYLEKKQLMAKAYEINITADSLFALEKDFTLKKGATGNQKQYAKEPSSIERVYGAENIKRPEDAYEVYSVEDIYDVYSVKDAYESKDTHRPEGAYQVYSIEEIYIIHGSDKGASDEQP